MWMLSWRSGRPSSSIAGHDTRGRGVAIFGDLSKTLPSAVERLAARVSEAVGAEVELERPKDPAHGDFATNVAMRSAKAIGRPPRELAQELAEKVVELDEIESADVAGPGFLNLRVGDRLFLDALAEIHEDYGGGWAATAELVQVEMGS